MEACTKFQKVPKIKQYVRRIDSLNETPKKAEQAYQCEDVVDVKTERLHDKT